jgi:hypothetical protein
LTTVTFLDKRFLQQTSFDSAVPTGTAVVAHELEPNSAYELSLARDDEIVSSVPVVATPMPEVDPSAEGQAAESVRSVRRAVTAVDLSKLLRPGGRPSEKPSVAPGGWVSFTSSRPVADHHVVVRRTKDARGGGEDVFDSRRLGERSVFAVTLLQPGRYSVENDIGGAKADVVVSYPQVGDAPYRPPDPLQVEVTGDGFGQERLLLSPAQGIVFRFRTEARIRIELVEPDEGPDPQPRPQARFRKSPAPDGPRGEPTP